VREAGEQAREEGDDEEDDEDFGGFGEEEEEEVEGEEGEQGEDCSGEEEGDEDEGGESGEYNEYDDEGRPAYQTQAYDFAHQRREDLHGTEHTPSDVPFFAWARDPGDQPWYLFCCRSHRL
jgi:hypothetical protein